MRFFVKTHDHNGFHARIFVFEPIALGMFQIALHFVK